MRSQFIRSGDGVFNVFCLGKIYTISPDFPTYGSILGLLNKGGELDENSLLNLLNPQKSIDFLSQGKVKADLTEGRVWYDGVEFPDKGLCDRILSVMSEGHDFQYIINFLERLGKNPNFRSVMQLFDFITHKGFPITPEGKFLAYKGIKSNHTDKWTGKIDNSVGNVVKMERSSVCQDFNKACAEGLHAGTLEYATGYAGSDGIIILVEIDPADVVSVPSAETEKLRCCKYRVVKDHVGSLLVGEVYNAEGKRVESATYGQFDNIVNNHWDDHTYGGYDRDEDDDDCDEGDDDDNSNDW